MLKIRQRNILAGVSFNNDFGDSGRMQELPNRNQPWFLLGANILREKIQCCCNIGVGGFGLWVRPWDTETT